MLDVARWQSFYYYYHHFTNEKKIQSLRRDQCLNMHFLVMEEGDDTDTFLFDIIFIFALIYHEPI